MVNDVIVNLMFDDDVLSTIVSIISIIVGGILVWAQLRNNSKMAKLESNLKNKGRIFEDKYSKTSDLLEKLGEYRADFEIMMNYIEQCLTDEEYRKLFNKKFYEFNERSNNFIVYSTTLRYWIGDELSALLNRTTKVMKEIAYELNKIYQGNIKILDLPYEPKEEEFKQIYQHCSQKTINPLIIKFYDHVDEIENMCIEKYK